MASMGSFSKSINFSTPTILLRSPSVRSKNQIGVFKAHLSDDTDPLFLDARNAASLRLLESYQPEPLFVDPYAGCFAVPNRQIKQYPRHFSVATKFIDDKLLQTLNHIGGLKQVVLLTDGMDARPYRLGWPMSTIIFDISPDRVFHKAAQELQVNGAKIPRGNMFYHVSLESPYIQQELCVKGFRGDRPSIWAMQGLPIKTLADFEKVLFFVSGLAMKGSLFIGEFPSCLVETETSNKLSMSATEKMKKIFLGNGFWVELISLEVVARRLGRELTLGPYKNTLFAAEQLRFSDDQMENWRKELQRIEEGVDEEGFEEL